MDFDKVPAADFIEAAAGSVRKRGITVEILATKADALSRIREIIPAGASVSTGASVTLREIGFEDLLKSGNHPWRNFKAEIAAEKDPLRQEALRKQSTLADFFLGSVHAIAASGELVIASMTGSQLAPYAFSSSHIVWVVGAQKLTPDLDGAIRRVREYVYPHEDARMRASTGGKMGSMIGKLLIFEQEAAFLNRSLNLLLVKERVGD